MNAKGSGPTDSALIDLVRKAGRCALYADDENDVQCFLAQALRDYVQCDLVFLSLQGRCGMTEAVADRERVRIRPLEEPDKMGALLDESRPADMSGGLFCPDVAASPFLNPGLRARMAEVGVQSAFIGPIACGNTFHGHLAFAWTAPRREGDIDPERLSGLLDIVCLQWNTFRLRMTSHYDTLTGLFNRQGLQHHWNRIAPGAQGALFFMDLDGFKAFNDRHGHLKGDAYLLRIADMLAELAPPGASVSRLGGDEFVMLAPDVKPRQAERLAQAIRTRCHDLAAEFPPPRPSVTVGIAHFPDDGTDLYELIQLADARVFEQKRSRATLTLVAGGDRRPVPLPQTHLQRWMDLWPDGIIVTDTDYRIIYVNRAFEKMSGYSLDEWIGKKPGFHASGKTSPETYRSMWESIAAEGSWTGQVINRHRSGREWVSLLSITRIVDEEGRLAGYLGTCRDITKTVWAGRKDIRKAFQEAFTQEALAFALAEAGQLHEGGSRQHLERIRDFTRLLVLGAADREYEPLRRYETRTAIILASILHDIGKLAIPDGLLRKPSPLTPEEYNLIKTHTIAGEQLLRSPYLSASPARPDSEFLAIAADIARSHHERWDGKGYPDGLKGEEIPLPARIVAIADVYDALRSRRPYKRAWDHEEAVAYIRDGAGTRFDPDLVAIFLELADEFRAVSEQSPDNKAVGSRSGGESYQDKAV